MSSNLPRVAVVGRPNVGKSTLVNRLAQGRGSIVGPSPGLTRDRIDTEVHWAGHTFILSDTGGIVEAAIGPDADKEISGKVANKAISAMESSDLVLFLIEAPAGITSDDLALVKRLRRIKVPMILVVNKADDDRAEQNSGEFWSLGLGEPMFVSSTHGRGTGDLLDRIVQLLPTDADAPERPVVPSIALVGRPNVGKSSLFNRFVGEERAIVHHEPGTTRDSIDTIVSWEGRSYRFVDTAGIRRRAKTQGVEIFSASRTRNSIERSDVAVLVIDAAEGATSQDQRIAEQVAEAGVGAVLSLNKWDLIEDVEVAAVTERTIKDRLHFVDYAPLVRTSAKTARGMQKLIGQVDVVLETRSQRIPTSALNQLVQDAQQRAPIPRSRNRSVKILYATQVGVEPPTFVLFSTGKLAISWLRFLERRLREEFGFVGNPIRLVERERSESRRTG